MSRFYASITGDNNTSKTINQEIPILISHIQGHTVGIRIYMKINDKGEDEASVYLTNGSSMLTPDQLIGKYTVKNVKGGL